MLAMAQVAAALAAPVAAQGPGGAWSTFQQWRGGPGEGYGKLIVAAGDVDGDAIGDVLVGSSYSEASGLLRSGFAALHSGRDGAILFQWPGAEQGAEFGHALAGAGDLDRDGVRDLLIGARAADHGVAENAGAVMIISGRTGLEVLRLHGESDFDYFGNGVACLGDVNGDAREEFLVHALYGSGRGAVYLFDGATGTLLRKDQPAIGARFNGTLVLMGDQDGDGHQDYGIGDSTASPGGRAGAGHVQLVSGLTGASLRTIDGPAAYDQIGWFIANADDVDGDGMDDLLAGVPGTYDTTPGAAYLLSSASSAVLMSWTGPASGGRLGYALGRAGDADGDGSPDLLLGAPDADQGTFQRAGAAYLYSSATGALLQSYAGSDWEAHLGHSVAGLGDLNGDRFDDFAIGAVPGIPGADGQFLIHGFDPFLTPTREAISVSAGTDMRLRMRFPQDTGFAFWQILASRAGRGSTTAFGLEIPLATDGVLLRTLVRDYPAYLHSGFGLLSSFGEGEAVIRLHPNQLPPSLIGSSIHFAAVARDPSGLGIYCSAAREVRFGP